MKTTQRGRGSSPLVIDSRLLGQIETVFAWIADKNLAKVAEVERVAVDTLRAIAAKGLASQLPPDRDDFHTDYDAYRQRVDLVDSLRRAATSLQYSSTISIRGEYSKNGRSFQVDAFDLLGPALEAGTGELHKLTFETAATSHPSLMVEFENHDLNTYIYRASGDLADVAYSCSRFQDVIDDAKPAHPWLHKYIPQIIIRFGFGIASAIFVIRLTGNVPLHWMPENMTPISIFLSASWFLLGAASGAQPVLTRYRSAFPSADFRFGNQERRVLGRRTGILLLVTSVVLPVLLAAVHLT